MIKKFFFPYNSVKEWILDEIIIGNINVIKGFGGLGWYFFFYYIEENSIFEECELCIDKDYITTLGIKFSYNNKIIEHLLESNKSVDFIVEENNIELKKLSIFLLLPITFFILSPSINIYIFIYIYLYIYIFIYIYLYVIYIYIFIYMLYIYIFILIHIGW